MRTNRILLIIIQIVLFMPGFGMSQEMNAFTTVKMDSIVDAKVQQNLDNKIELYVDEVSKAYQMHDNEMKDWYTALGTLIAIVCVVVSIGGVFSPYMVNKQFEKRLDEKEREMEDRVSEFKKEIEANKKQTQAMVYYLRAREKNNIDDKIKLCEKAVDCYSNYSLAYKLLGASYFRKKEYRKAIKYCSLALEIDDDENTFITRALAYSKDNQHDKAIADYDSAITINSTNDNMYFNKAQKLFNMGKVEDAKPIIEKAINLKEKARYYELSCRIYEELNDKASALDAAQQGLKIVKAEIAKSEKKTWLDFFEKKINDLGGAS